MIDGLIGGKLHGKPFVTCKVRTPTTAGDTLFVNVITFSENVGSTLLALDDGDSVSLSGALTPKIWTDSKGEARVVLDMVAHGALTAYHAGRKRQAARELEEVPA